MGCSRGPAVLFNLLFLNRLSKNVVADEVLSPYCEAVTSGKVRIALITPYELRWQSSYVVTKVPVSDNEWRVKKVNRSFIPPKTLRSADGQWPKSQTFFFFFLLFFPVLKLFCNWRILAGESLCIAISTHRLLYNPRFLMARYILNSKQLSRLKQHFLSLIALSFTAITYSGAKIAHNSKSGLILL